MLEPLVFKETRQKSTQDGQAVESFKINEIRILDQDAFVITFSDDTDGAEQLIDMVITLQSLLESAEIPENEKNNALGDMQNIAGKNVAIFSKSNMKICFGLFESASFISHELAGVILGNEKFQQIASLKKSAIKTGKIPFLKSEDGGFSEMVFGDKDLTIITKGQIEEPVRGTLIEIIKELRSIKKLDRKMCSVYLIQEGEKYTWYVSISGSTVSEMTYNQLRQKLKAHGQNIVLISSSLERKTIPEESEKEDGVEDNYEDLNRTDLFKRFLMAAVSDYDGNDPKRYPELKKRFSLSEQHDVSVKALKLARAVAEAKGVELQREIIALDLFCYNIFYPKKLGAKQFGVMADGGLRGTLLNVDLTQDVLDIKPCIDFLRQPLLEVMSEAELEEIYQHIESLWDHLMHGLSNFEMSHLLSHCSESNLIDYLYDNLEILSRPGEHYLFSFLLMEENAQEPEIHDLCDICTINAVEHFSNLQQKLGKSSKREIHAAIPILPVQEQVETTVGKAPHAEFFAPSSPPLKQSKEGKPLHRTPSTLLQKLTWEKEEEESNSKKLSTISGPSNTK